MKCVVFALVVFTVVLLFGCERAPSDEDRQFWAGASIPNLIKVTKKF